MRVIDRLASTKLYQDIFKAAAVKIMGKAQLNRELTGTQVKQIVAFLNSLSGQINPAEKNFPVELTKK